MASLRRIRKATRRTQPQGSIQIDWCNPLTRGLVAAINPAAPDPQLVRVGTPVYVPTTGTATQSTIEAKL